MACLAGGQPMCPVKSEVGYFMVERFRIQLNDVRVPAFMVGVTARALRIVNQATATMKTSSVSNILRDLLMAVETQPSLASSLEFLMAGGAIGFVLGVTLNQLTRHDECFDSGCPGGIENC